MNEPERHEEFLGQIVATLGYIGADIAVQPLIGFVKSPRTGRAVFNAKNIALIRLGDLANRSGSKAAVEFLAQVARDTALARTLAAPQAALEQADAGKAGLSPVSAETLAAELAVSATFGLALAGTEAARRTVDALKADQNAFASVNQAAGEAAHIAATVVQQGRDAYYRMKQQQRHQL